MSVKHSDALIHTAQKHVAKLRGSLSSGSASVAAAEIPEMVVTLLGCHTDLYDRVADVSVYHMTKTKLPRRE
jgi:hypothetical protein